MQNLYMYLLRTCALSTAHLLLCNQPQTLLPSLFPTTSVPVVVEPVRSILASNLSSVFVGKIISEVGLCVCVCIQILLHNGSEEQQSCVLIISGTGTCSCDVLVEKCNVYCCCDEECTSYEQMSFHCSDSRYIIIITCTYKINTVM